MSAKSNGRGLRKRVEPFVQVRSKTVNDDAITYRALGILVNVLDKPEGWVVNAKQLARPADREGDEAVGTALRELRRRGYYRAEKRRLRSGRIESGGAVSETPMETWAKQHEFFGGKEVPLVEQPDGSFMVRYPDGTLQPDDFPPPEPADDDDHGGDNEGAGGTESGFPGLGGGAPTEDGFPRLGGSGSTESGFPGPGKPTSGDPAPENPDSYIRGFTQTGYTDSVPPTEVRRDAAATSTSTTAQPPLDSDVFPPLPSKADFDQQAFGIARRWMDWRASQNVPVAGKDALHKLKSLVKPFLEAKYTEDEVKRALNGLKVAIPSAQQLQGGLDRVRGLVPQRNDRSGYGRPPAGALDVNSAWAADVVPIDQNAPDVWTGDWQPVEAGATAGGGW